MDIKPSSNKIRQAEAVIVQFEGFTLLGLKPNLGSVGSGGTMARHVGAVGTD